MCVVHGWQAAVGCLNPSDFRAFFWGGSDMIGWDFRAGKQKTAGTTAQQNVSERCISIGSEMWLNGQFSKAALPSAQLTFGFQINFGRWPLEVNAQTASLYVCETRGRLKTQVWRFRQKLNAKACTKVLGVHLWRSTPNAKSQSKFQFGVSGWDFRICE